MSPEENKSKIPCPFCGQFQKACAECDFDFGDDEAAIAEIADAEAREEAAHE